MENDNRTDSSLQGLLSLKGRIALVTGGCRNFGAEMAVGLAEAGATVAVTAREFSRAKDGAAALKEQTGFDFIPFELELTDENSVQKLFQFSSISYKLLEFVYL